MPNKPASHKLGEVCPRCGFVHMQAAHPHKPACVGHKRSDPSKACGAGPRPGQNVCGTHGGLKPAAKANGEQRDAEQQITAAARVLIPDLADLPKITDPLSRLLDLAAEADGFRESLRHLSNELEGRIRYDGERSGEQLRAEVATYRQALRDVTDLLIAVARLDIDARLARIEERKVELVVRALGAALDDADLSAEQKRKVMVHAGRHLRAVAS